MQLFFQTQGPAFHFFKGCAATSRIEEYQYERRIVQKELMDETVFILSAEVPQGHVACLARRGDGVGIELLWSQGPQLHAEGGALFFVALFCQSQRQTRFPDVAFTNEDNFGAGRVDNLGCCRLNIIQRGTCVYCP